ncbi:helix-hairpin-helix domain-containing protein [Sporosarcina sp. Te-1]|uniref:helix-hairpin-helix domain-containing protein n=1 Tax=Sporosarcina sp. Te-1 TaxID=2818390 RepID=UPI001A9D4912|nr:helix-hairpin-helix domain-containing protein [Sporosarcina sp. Te-1]QTD41640.1 helix-hairpin-helix domain-containing protein [Sporosarcina sp. Te-1]
MEPEKPSPVVVDVKGAVNFPGVYALTDENRLIDAIEAAGGYLPNADSRLLNHAMKLKDELVIYVPEVGEVLDGFPAETIGLEGESSSREDGTVNINTASEQELMTIPGIGPSKAAAIVQYREEHGPFPSEKDLTKVSGIGQKTFENLESFISVK